MTSCDKMMANQQIRSRFHAQLWISRLTLRLGRSPGEIEVRNWWYILQVNTVGSSAIKLLRRNRRNRDISIPKFVGDPRCLATPCSPGTCSDHGCISHLMLRLIDIQNIVISRLLSLALQGASERMAMTMFFSF